jgi:hypothetical protein
VLFLGRCKHKLSYGAILQYGGLARAWSVRDALPLAKFGDRGVGDPAVLLRLSPPYRAALCPGARRGARTPPAAHAAMAASFPPWDALNRGDPSALPTVHDLPLAQVRFPSRRVSIALEFAAERSAPRFGFASRLRPARMQFLT